MKLSTWMTVAISAAAAGTVGILAMNERRRAQRGEPHLYGRPGWLASRADRAIWSFDNRFQALSPGKTLRVEVMSPAIVRWTTDQWKTVHETRTVRSGRVEAAELDTASLPTGSRIQFTFFWPQVNRWEGQDFEVRVAERARYGGAAGD